MTLLGAVELFFWKSPKQSANTQQEVQVHLRHHEYSLIKRLFCNCHAYLNVVIDSFAIRYVKQYVL